MTPSDKRGARPLGDALSALFASKGFARLRAAGELEYAWIAAAGDSVAKQTKLGGVRHGVLLVTVGHSALLEELAAFRKSELLAALRAKVPGLSLQDIRFRVGPVDLDPAEPPPTSKPSLKPKAKPKRRKSGD
jgi:predicted nucleic acid-binding Zn ribbon protein